jgi:methylamine dehydrogenase light chain
VSNFDRLAEKMVRGVASRTSRRSLFGMLGTLLAGTASLPLLPVARAADGAGSGKDAPINSGNLQDPGDQTSCDYWRYCAIDGSL